MHSGDVFPDHVKFQVDEASRVDGLDIGMFEGVRDDRDVEFRLFYVEDGEADAVEADGAFFDNEGAEFLWEFEPEFPGAVEVFAVDAGGGGVYVALDDVAVEAAVHQEASFQVDEVAWLPVGQVGLFQGLLDGGYAVEAVCAFFHCEADAVMGNALVNFEFVGDRGGDPECLVGSVGLDGDDFAEGFYYTGKHMGANFGFYGK